MGGSARTSGSGGASRSSPKLRPSVRLPVRSPGHGSPGLLPLAQPQVPVHHRELRGREGEAQAGRSAGLAGTSRPQPVRALPLPGGPCVRPLAAPPAAPPRPSRFRGRAGRGPGRVRSYSAATLSASARARLAPPTALFGLGPRLFAVSARGGVHFGAGSDCALWNPPPPIPPSRPSPPPPALYVTSEPAASTLCWSRPSDRLLPSSGPS